MKRDKLRKLGRYRTINGHKVLEIPSGVTLLPDSETNDEISEYLKIEEEAKLRRVSEEEWDDNYNKLY